MHISCSTLSVNSRGPISCLVAKITFVLPYIPIVLAYRDVVISHKVKTLLFLLLLLFQLQCAIQLSNVIDSTIYFDGIVV